MLGNSRDVSGTIRPLPGPTGEKLKTLTQNCPCSSQNYRRERLDVRSTAVTASLLGEVANLVPFTTRKGKQCFSEFPSEARSVVYVTQYECPIRKNVTYASQTIVAIGS